MKRTFQGIFLFIASKMHCRSLSQRRSGQRNLTKCKSRPSICTRQIISIHISLWQIHSYLGKILQLGKALSPNALARPKAWSWLKRITALLSIGSWSRRMPFNASSLLIAAGPWRQVKWAGRMFRYRETLIATYYYSNSDCICSPQHLCRKGVAAIQAYLYYMIYVFYIHNKF